MTIRIDFPFPDIGAAEAKATFVRVAVTRFWKMLRNARTAGSGKPQCGDGQAVECLLWAGSAVKGGNTLQFCRVRNLRKAAAHADCGIGGMTLPVDNRFGLRADACCTRPRLRLSTGSGVCKVWRTARNSRRIFMPTDGSGHSYNLTGAFNAGRR